MHYSSLINFQKLFSRHWRQGNFCKKILRARGAKDFFMQNYIAPRAPTFF
jgi:hypothetical protein